MLLAGVALDRAVHGLSGGERRRCSLAAVAAGRRRPADPRRADQPPRRRGGGLAGRPPGPSYVCAGGGHPRPLVPRRGLRAHLGGAPGRTAPGWSTPTTAGTPPSCSPRPSGSGRPRPPSRAGRTWCARSWPGCVAARRPAPSKPKFRIDAANALIEDVPPPRDRLELQRFATQRLGKDVVDLEDVDLTRGDRTAAARTRPGGSARATGSASSGSTAPARARCWPGLRRRCSPTRAGSSAAGRSRSQHLTQHVAGRGPGRPGAADASRTSAGSPGPPTGKDVSATLDAGAVRLHGRQAHRAARRPLRW